MSIVQHNLDLLGAILTVIFYSLSILIFVFRLCSKPHFGYWLGILMFVCAAPLVYLLIKAPELHRPTLYYVQIGLMLLWMAVTLLLDYILKINFRQIKWMVISYVILFFAGTGGLLGVATWAGRGWSILTIALFLIMAVLAFVQRRVTGM